jgi:hypothetical protein
MNRRSAVAAALSFAVAGDTLAQGSPVTLNPNPGRCFPALIYAEDWRGKFHAQMRAWSTVAAKDGVQTAYVMLDPRHARLAPKRGVLSYAGVRLFVQVAPGPLPGGAEWSVLPECGRTL